MVTARIRRLLQTFLIPVLSVAIAGPGQAGSEPRWQAGSPESAKVVLYFFWAASCPHCRDAHPFVDTLAREPWIKLESRDVTAEREGRQLFESLAGTTGQSATSVPSFFYCGQGWSGFDGAGTTGARLARGLYRCFEETWGRPPPVTPALAGIATGHDTPDTIRLPIGGDVDVTAMSLPVLTVVMASLDAFNPCAFFVLLFLLSLLTHTRSRRRMLLIGGVFILVSGLVYFLFMSAWLSVFSVMGGLPWITAAAGLLAATIGLFNIKDFLRPGGKVSLGMNRDQRSALFERTRNLLQIDALVPVIGATLLLAVAANSYELLCTAGFPMVYTRVLTLEDLDGAGRLAWLAAYNLIYVLPLLVILVTYVFTLGSRKLTAREGRALKLLSGLMMLGLGLLLLVWPEALTDPVSALVLMGLAVVVTVAAHYWLPEPA